VAHGVEHDLQLSFGFLNAEDVGDMDAAHHERVQLYSSHFDAVFVGNDASLDHVTELLVKIASSR